MNSREQYLQLRIQKLNTMLENADVMIRRLIEDAELTESIGCAFAFDLGVELEGLRKLGVHSSGYENGCDCIEGTLVENWNQAVKGLK